MEKQIQDTTLIGRIHRLTPRSNGDTFVYVHEDDGTEQVLYVNDTSATHYDSLVAVVCLMAMTNREGTFEVGGLSSTGQREILSIDVNM